MATAAPEIPLLPRDKEFENLYRQYVKDVYHYALALLRNPADAEDVTQTTFMNAYRAFQRGEVVRKPQNWLIKIAHNVARSRYARTTRRVKEVPLDDHVEQLAMPEAERTNVEGVLRALGRLPFNQRAALIMRELEGRSYVEIADTLGVSVPAVETLIFRARRSLRVRTAALRSILAVPVPSSLTQLFAGGGAVVGGAGAGFVVKAAIALVAGAVATGVSSDRGTRAVAAPDKSPRDTGTQVATSTKQHITVVRTQAGERTKKADRLTGHSGPSRVVGQGSAGMTESPVASVVVSHPTASSSSPASAPAPASVTTTVSTTATTVTGTVEQTVSTVTSAVPQVTVPVPPLPPLPVEPPPLPKLP
jgi:RNA polymerase sigma factor (sigma-70 family)